MIRNQNLSTRFVLTATRISGQLAQLQFLRFPAPGWLPVAVGLALLSSILIPLNLLASQPFHHDEALYTTWALEIASGDNPWLVQVPIDKPPLFLYTVAGAMWLLGATEAVARLPSLLATALTVGLTFWLGRKLYNNGVGLVAAWLVALSPFTILFAPTAFTDPMLVALMLVACLATAYNRTGWAGVWLGLAIATKQQGVFFVPLVIALQVASRRWQVAGGRWQVAGGRWHHFTRCVSHLMPHTSRFTLHLPRLLLTMLATLLPLFFWDLFRNQAPGFWQLSLLNYGGLTIITATAAFAESWWAFVALLYYGTASRVLNMIFLGGLPLLLIYGVWQSKTNKGGQAFISTTATDLILTVFSLAFLGGHAWLSFQVWDRYLLGLIPLLALLLARVLWLPWSIFKAFWLEERQNLLPLSRVVAGLALSLLLALTLVRPVQDAANARYPLGSNSHALQGIKQIVAYLQGRVGANTTLYHRWLGPHWRFYLWKYPFDLQYWESPQALVAKARPGHLIAFPTWQSDTEARLALAEAGLGLKELNRAYTPSGYPSIILYQVQSVAR